MVRPGVVGWAWDLPCPVATWVGSVDASKFGGRESDRISTGVEARPPVVEAFGAQEIIVEFV